MCLGVYACKKILTHVLRKIKASFTNWLIWIISLKLCFANILSRICQIRNHHTLKLLTTFILLSWLARIFFSFRIKFSIFNRSSVLQPEVIKSVSLKKAALEAYFRSEKSWVWFKFINNQVEKKRPRFKIQKKFAMQMPHQ